MIGQALNKIRKEKNLSLDELAKLSTISKRMIWNIEKDLNSPTIALLEKICTALKINLKDLFKEDSKSKYTNVILDNMKETTKKTKSIAKEKKPKAMKKTETVEQKILTENKKAPLKEGLIFNKKQLLALAELQAYTLENHLPCFEILVNIPNYLNEKVFTRKELDALKSIVFYIASQKFKNTDIDKVAKELKDFLLVHGESEVKVINSFNSDDSEVA